MPKTERYKNGGVIVATHQDGGRRASCLSRVAAGTGLHPAAGYAVQRLPSSHEADVEGIGFNALACIMSTLAHCHTAI